MVDAVGDKNRPAHSFGRRFAQRLLERAEELGAFVAGVVATRLDDARLDIVEPCELLLDLGSRFVGLPFALAEPVARRAVDDHRDDVF